MIFHVPIDQQLGRIRAANQGHPRKRVLILGAGMAGLSAAHELLRLGHEVQLIEATSGRVGGRVWTHHFSDGTYGELGAMRVPASHDYTRHYLKITGLTDLRPFIGSSRIFDYKGTITKSRESLAKLFKLSEQDRKSLIEEGLDGIFLRIMGELIGKLTCHEKEGLFENELRTPDVLRLDSQTLHQYLSEKADTPDAVTLTGWGLGLNGLWERSVILFLREEIEGAFTGLEELPGGLDQLPNRLADLPIPGAGTIRERIRFNTEVLGLEVRRDGVIVRVKPREGSEESIAAPYVLCTLPYTVLRKLALSGLGKPKLEAIQQLGATASTKVLLNCTHRVWEKESDGFAGGYMPSDRLTRQTYYPSDGPADPQRPGVLLGSYSWGEAARSLGDLPQEQRCEKVVKSLAHAHPGLPESLSALEPCASMAWHRYPWAQSAFGALAPGDLAKHFPAAASPEGRLAVAGEHISPFQSWIQGAVWSALRAVQYIAGQEG